MSIYSAKILTVKNSITNISIKNIARKTFNSHTAFFVLSVFFGILYIINLNSNGFANEYYSAAAQAGAHSWKAFLYGTSDFNANITVDKPPASLWLPSLCIRIFGLSPWSILLPEVFMLLLSIRLLYTHIERHFDTLTAWITSFLFASTPLIFIMFRYNNPEALMTLLIIAMATTTDKALNTNNTQRSICWLFFAGLLAGFAFLTKQLEALMSLPALAITIALFLPESWRIKMIGLGTASLGLLLGASWWIALVELVPKSHRPYIGGSPTNDFIELTLGYNGISRVLGTSFNQFHFHGYPQYYDNEFSLAASKPGIARFFYSQDASQIGWLLGISLLAILIFSWTFFIFKLATHGQKALITSWTLTLATMFPIFTFMGTAFHTYYPVIMAPSLAILSGILLGYLWQNRQERWAKEITLLTLIIVGAQYYANYQLENNYLGIMRWVSIVLASTAALSIIIYWYLPKKYLSYLAGIISLIAVFSGPLVFSASSFSPQVPGLPVAGPTTELFHTHKKSLEKQAALDRIVAQISIDGDRYLWTAATIGMRSSYFQLRSGYSILPIGGFIGADNNISLETLKKFITEKKIHYFITDSDNADDYFPNIAPLYIYIKNNFPVQKISADAKKPNTDLYLYDLTK